MSWRIITGGETADKKILVALSVLKEKVVEAKLDRHFYGCKKNEFDRRKFSDGCYLERREGEKTS